MLVLPGSGWSFAIEYRPGKLGDLWHISKQTGSEFMNPLVGLDPQRFLVAQDETSERIGWAQIKPIDENLYELSSVWVNPEYRHQGIGSSLVKNLLDQHVKRTGSRSNVYLVTLDSRAAWYKDQFGFEEVVDANDIPKSMSFEV